MASRSVPNDSAVGRALEKLSDILRQAMGSGRIVGVCILFAAVAVIAATMTSTDTLRAVSAPLLGVTVTMAIFAVNFAFLSFQLSPYRAVAVGVPGPLYAGAAITTLLSVIPIVALPAGEVTAGRVAVAMIPVLAFCALALVRLAQREGTPTVIIGRLTSPSRTEFFAQRLAVAVHKQFLRSTTLERGLEPGEDQVPPPMHEAMHDPLPPPVEGDPLQALVRVGRAAVGREDLAVFSRVTSAFFEVAASLTKYEFHAVGDMPAHRPRRACDDLIADRLFGLVAGVERDLSAQPIAEGFVEACADYARAAFHRGAADSDLTRTVAARGIAVVDRLMRESRRGPSFISILAALRQVNELALRQQPEFLVEHGLAYYASCVASLGETAIDVRDNEALYRCLETLAWIGCSAVRYDATETGRRSADGLVQLGRRARAENVECFWTRCSRTPYDHAVEHLTWMVSWTPRAANGHAGSWLGTLGRALSRMRGVDVKLTFDEASEPPEVDASIGTNPYKDSVQDHGVHRTYDYSDPTMVDAPPLR